VRLAIAIGIASIQLWEVLGHEYAGHCHNMQVMMHDADLGIASLLGGRFVICRNFNLCHLRVVVGGRCSSIRP
jgi:hypothetical protein